MATEIANRYKRGRGRPRKVGVSDGEEKSDRLALAGTRVTTLATMKDREYGDAYPKIAAILRILYPDHIPEEQYDVIPKVVRNIEKLCRLSAGHRDDVAVDICGIWLNQIAEEWYNQAVEE